MTVPLLGDIKIVKTYVFYNNPILFTITDKKENYYLCLVLYNYTKITNNWIVARINKRINNNLIKSNIPVRNFFMSASKKYHIIFNTETEEATTSLVDNFEYEHLPAQDFFLKNNSYKEIYS